MDKTTISEQLKATERYMNPWTVMEHPNNTALSVRRLRTCLQETLDHVESLPDPVKVKPIDTARLDTALGRAHGRTADDIWAWPKASLETLNIYRAALTGLKTQIDAQNLPAEPSLWERHEVVRAFKISRVTLSSGDRWRLYSERGDSTYVSGDFFSPYCAAVGGYCVFKLDGAAEHVSATAFESAHKPTHKETTQ